jgi:hypothetical protein
MAIEPPGAIQHVQLLGHRAGLDYFEEVLWGGKMDGPAEARMPEGLMGLKTRRFLLLDVI